MLARATPVHKDMMIYGLKQLGKNILYTGDSVNDVKCVDVADVGIAMGSGCSAVKQVSDLILTGDDFGATVRAVKWGRNIYHSVGRFLQFQLTVNLSALMTIALGSFFLAESPLSAAQLLWINLIMDTLAAFALATEPPLDSVLAGEPFKEGSAVLTPTIWRQVLGISIWNTLVMLGVIVLVPPLTGLEYGLTTSPKDSGDWGDAKKRHMTYIFNTFISLQLFNEVNCRKIGRRDFNVLESIWGNWHFLLVVLGTLAAQVLLTQYCSALFRTTPLDRSEWGGCLALGATPWLIAVLLKLTPERWLASVKVDKLVNEDRTVENRGLLKLYNDTAKAKIKVGAKKDGESDNFSKVK